MKHFEVVPVPMGEGWVMVAALGQEDRESAALFRPEYREVAQEFADRLNVRAAVAQLLTCPKCGQPADQVDRQLGKPTEYGHKGPGGQLVVHLDRLPEIGR